MTPLAPAPQIDPVKFLKELADAEKVLQWMDRLRWIAGLLPFVLVLAIQGVFFARLKENEALDLHLWLLPLGAAAATGAVCLAGLWWMSRHFRRVIRDARAKVEEKFPNLKK